MSGGKGGSQTASTTIPKWARKPMIQNLNRAKAMQRIDYMPYYGPDVAAFNPAQRAAMNSTGTAAKAFGLVGPKFDANKGLPRAQGYGNGIRGYSGQPIMQRAVNQVRKNDNNSYRRRMELFANPDGKYVPRKVRNQNKQDRIAARKEAQAATTGNPIIDQAINDLNGQGG